MRWIERLIKQNIICVEYVKLIIKLWISFYHITSVQNILIITMDNFLIIDDIDTCYI